MTGPFDLESRRATIKYLSDCLWPLDRIRQLLDHAAATGRDPLTMARHAVLAEALVHLYPRRLPPRAASPARMRGSWDTSR